MNVKYRKCYDISGSFDDKDRYFPSSFYLIQNQTVKSIFYVPLSIMLLLF